jgi:flavin reductase (DIM6/NTAB) family NADH-FMN oxidoreductase RutF
VQTLPFLFFASKTVRDNSIKHTLINCEAEVVINVIFDLVQQTSLQAEYADGVNEFDKAGLTAVPSDLVRPFRVKNLQCNLNVKSINYPFRN